MTTLLVSEFKSRCLAILERVHSEGEEVLVCRRGKPLTRVIPVGARGTGKRRSLGDLAGEAFTRGDLVHFDTAGDWESAS